MGIESTSSNIRLEFIQVFWFFSLKSSLVTVLFSNRERPNQCLYVKVEVHFVYGVHCFGIDDEWGVVSCSHLSWISLYRIYFSIDFFGGPVRYWNTGNHSFDISEVYHERFWFIYRGPLASSRKHRVEVGLTCSPKIHLPGHSLTE
jgi:hypothetical protein